MLRIEPYPERTRLTTSVIYPEGPIIYPRSLLVYLGRSLVYPERINITYVGISFIKNYFLKIASEKQNL